MTRVQRLDKPSNTRWLITAVPDANAAVTVVLPLIEDCNDVRASWWSWSGAVHDAAAD